MIWIHKIEVKNRTTGGTIARQVIHFKTRSIVILKQIKKQKYAKY